MDDNMDNKVTLTHALLGWLVCARRRFLVRKGWECGGNLCSVFLTNWLDRCVGSYTSGDDWCNNLCPMQINHEDESIRI